MMNFFQLLSYRHMVLETFSLTTPSKSIASLAFIIAKRGLINIELEKIDYSRAVMNSTSYNYINENSNISNYYKNE